METIFAKIIRGELPSKKIYESEHVLVIEDIHPKAPIHWLFLPKSTEIVEMKDLIGKELFYWDELLKAIQHVVKLHALPGYRIVINNGRKGGQLIPHLHLHLLAGWKEEVEFP